MLKKRVALFLVFCCLIAIGGAILSTDKEDARESSGEDKAGEIVAKTGNDEDAALNLDIKTVLLSQGEGGIELWRLKATWAKLLKHNDLIIVEAPNLTYFMKEEGKTLLVISKTGDIEQKSRIIRFIDNVRVTQDDKLFTGDLLVYNGTQKSMLFPSGVDFSDAGINARADSLIWLIDQKFITAMGNVSVEFARSEKLFVK
ncbi:MAG: LPS export ABC transporter periplasmic protein LptC [Desulfovibrio sp.]|nr:LPS export ABC transporter periplasmic protein LptC [Desulfovibrio sp.]